MSTAETRTPSKSLTQERILTAATDLFAQFGYSGTSTRDIASAACVNEVTIYRYFPRKHDLYLACLGAELQKTTLRGDLLSRVANSQDAAAALAMTFEVVTLTIAGRPKLLRLIQYGALELNEDFNPIVRHHVGELLEVLSRYLDPWIASGALRCNSAKAVVLALVAIVLAQYSLSRIFLTAPADQNNIFEAYSVICATFS